MAGSLGKLVVEIGADISDLKRKFGQAQSEIEQVGQNLSGVGMGLTAGLTVPLLGIAAAATKIGLDFEASTTKLRTQIGLSKEEVDGMKGAVLDLSGETGRAPLELAEAMFTIQSAGARGAEALAILGASAKGASLNMGATKDISKALVSITTAYADSNITAGQAMETFMLTVREGNLEASELAPTLGKILPIASSMGIGITEVGASIATMTRLGVSSAEAITGLKSTLSSIQMPSQAAQDAMAKMGLTFDDLKETIKTDGLADALIMLKAKSAETGVEMSEIIPNVEGLATVLGTAGAQGEEYARIAADMNAAMAETTTESASLNEAFAVQSETAGFKLSQAMAKLSAAGVVIGDMLLPPLASLAGLVADVAGWFSGLSTPVQNAIGAFAAVAAAIGPILLIGGKLIGFMGPAGKLATSLKSVGMLFNPWTLAIAAVIAGVVLLIKNWDEIAAWFQTTFPGVVDTATGVFEDIQAAAEVVVDRVKVWFGDLVDSLSDAWDRYGSAVLAVWAQVKNTIGSAFEVILNIFGIFANAFAGDWAGVWDNVKAIGVTVWNFLKQTVANGLNFIIGMLPGFVKEWLGIEDEVVPAVASLADELSAAEMATIMGTTAAGAHGAALDDAAASIRKMTEDTDGAAEAVTGLGDAHFKEEEAARKSAEAFKAWAKEQEELQKEREKEAKRVAKSIADEADRLTERQVAASFAAEERYEESFQSLEDFAFEAADGIGETFEGLEPLIVDPFQSAISSVGDLFGVGGLGGIVGRFQEQLSGPGGLAGAIGSVAESFGLGAGVGGWAGSIANVIGGLTGGGGLGSAVAGIAGKLGIGGPLAGGLSGIVGLLSGQGGVGDAVLGVASLIPGVGSAITGVTAVLDKFGIDAGAIIDGVGKAALSVAKGIGKAISGLLGGGKSQADKQGDLLSEAQKQMGVKLAEGLNRVEAANLIADAFKDWLSDVGWSKRDLVGVLTGGGASLASTLGGQIAGLVTAGMTDSRFGGRGDVVASNLLTKLDDGQFQNWLGNFGVTMEEIRAGILAATGVSMEAVQALRDRIAAGDGPAIDPDGEDGANPDPTKGADGNADANTVADRAAAAAAEAARLAAEAAAMVTVDIGFADSLFGDAFDAVQVASALAARGLNDQAAAAFAAVTPGLIAATELFMQEAKDAVTLGFNDLVSPLSVLADQTADAGDELAYWINRAASLTNEDERSNMLNNAGRNAMGMLANAGGIVQHINVELDGRAVAAVVVENLPSVVNTRLGRGGA